MDLRCCLSPVTSVSTSFLGVLKCSKLLHHCPDITGLNKVLSIKVVKAFCRVNAMLSILGHQDIGLVLFYLLFLWIYASSL